MFILGSLRKDALVLLFPIWSGRDEGRWKKYFVVRKLVDCEIRVLLLSFIALINMPSSLRQNVSFTRMYFVCLYRFTNSKTFRNSTSLT